MFWPNYVFSTHDTKTVGFHFSVKRPREPIKYQDVRVKFLVQIFEDHKYVWNTVLKPTAYVAGFQNVNPSKNSYFINKNDKILYSSCFFFFLSRVQLHVFGAGGLAGRSISTDRDGRAAAACRSIEAIHLSLCLVNHRRTSRRLRDYGTTRSTVVAALTTRRLSSACRPSPCHAAGSLRPSHRVTAHQQPASQQPAVDTSVVACVAWALGCWRRHGGPSPGSAGSRLWIDACVVGVGSGVHFTLRPLVSHPFAVFRLRSPAPQGAWRIGDLISDKRKTLSSFFLPRVCFSAIFFLVLLIYDLQIMRDIASL